MTHTQSPFQSVNTSLFSSFRLPMPRLFVAVVAVAFFALLNAIFVAPAQAQSNTYQIGAGDLIDISVYDENDLSFPVRIGDSGTITFPFIGEIRVLGITPIEIESLISERLISGEFLVRPEVTVNILEYRPFYIDGEVVRPGSYPFEPGLTLRKAITIAGGFTERASRSKISILSSTISGFPSSAPAEILETSVNPDDIITVEPRFF